MPIPSGSSADVNFERVCSAAQEFLLRVVYNPSYAPATSPSLLVVQQALYVNNKLGGSRITEDRLLEWLDEAVKSKPDDPWIALDAALACESINRADLVSKYEKQFQGLLTMENIGGMPNRFQLRVSQAEVLLNAAMMKGAAIFKCKFV